MAQGATMAIEIRWVNAEKTILIQHFQGYWTVNDYKQMVDESAQLLQTVPHIVHIIADGTHNQTAPLGMLGGMRYALRKLPPNQGIVVFVRPNHFLETIIQMGRMLAPHLLHTTFVAETVDEALQIIAQKADLMGKTS
jgi:hypothetical protein